VVFEYINLAQTAGANIKTHGEIAALPFLLAHGDRGIVVGGINEATDIIHRIRAADRATVIATDIPTNFANFGGEFVENARRSVTLPLAHRTLHLRPHTESCSLLPSWRTHLGGGTVS